MNQLKLTIYRLRLWLLDLFRKEHVTVENNNYIYSESELMARLKFFIGICLSLTLFGIVFVVLYSLIFVTQPLNAISPIDQKFFELIIPIATFLTGTLSGIMLASGDPEAQKQALAAANKGWDKPPTPIQTTPTAPTPFGGNSFGTLGSAPVPPMFNGMPVNNAGMNYQPPMDFQPQVVTGFGGKPMPVQPPQPEI
jgi:hypothetical protein